MMVFSPDTPMYFCALALKLMNFYVMICVNQDIILFFGISMFSCLFFMFSLSFPILKMFIVISRLSLPFVDLLNTIIRHRRYFWHLHTQAILLPKPYPENPIPCVGKTERLL